MFEIRMVFQRATCLVCLIFSTVYTTYNGLQICSMVEMLAIAVWTICNH